MALGPQVVDQVYGPDEATGHVVANVDRVGGDRRFVCEQMVEGRHAVALGRRHLEGPASVVETSGAYPAGGPLKGMEGR